MNRPRIGCQVDHDMRLYRFERTSGLPVGYFDAPRLRSDVIMVALAVAVLWAIFAGCLA